MPERFSPRVVDARSTDPRALRTRAAIVDATSRLLAQSGDFSVGQLVVEAGISRASFYTHFTGVSEIIGLLLEERFSTIRTEFLAEAASDDISLQDAVRHAHEVIVRSIDDYRGPLKSMLTGPGRADVRDHLAIAIVRGLLMPDGDDSAFPESNIDSRMAAVYTSEAATGLLSAWVTDVISATPEQMVDHLIALRPDWLKVGE